MPEPALFLDSNVFLYAAGREHPLRDACRQLLERVAAGEVTAATSSEVLQEILHVLTRRGLRREAVELTRSILDLVPEVLAVRRQELALACELMEERHELNPRDAIHVATLRGYGLQTIVTADHHFDGIDDVRRLDPTDAARA
jgi:uncharacterized protein